MTKLVDISKEPKEVGDVFYQYHDTGLNPQMPEKSLTVILPNGAWFDLLFAEQGGWTWHGEPENITVEPSIWSDKGGSHDWHGYLRNGEFEEA